MARWPSLLALTIGWVLLTGCSSAPQKPVTIQDYQGKVDTSLPPELQAKQEALRRLLNGLQEGIGDTAALNLFVPGIEYREPFPKFFEGVRLTRWEFSGKPNQSDIAVVLYFDDKHGGPVDPAQERKSERVYTVVGNGRTFVISRK